MKIRIGKELHISWSILTQGENKHLEGRDLRLYLQDPNRRRRALEFTTDDNTLLVVIPAKSLTRIGRYALILTENEGQEGQTAVDANPAFTLVETSREEDTNTTEAPNLEVATINLTTGNLTLRMVIQELFDGKDGGDMKTGDILPVLRDGELHRVSAKIGAGPGADCSAEIEALTAKVEENAANIAGAAADASAALTAAQGAQAAATSASENAAQAKELATEAKKAADTATRMLRFSSIIYDANIEEQEGASISPDFLIVFVKVKGLFVASDGGKYYKVFSGSDDYNTTLDGVTKARQDRLFFIQSLEENKYYHYDGVALRLLTTSEPEIAGRVWNEDNATPKAESYYGSLKALRDLPKRLGLGRYIVKDDRTRRKLDPNDSHKYLDDGSTANLDGTDGQCMWCWNGFYANIWHDGSRLIKAVTFDGPVGGETSVWIPAGGISWFGAGVIDRGDAPYTDKTKWKLCSVINNSEQFRGGNGVALDPSNYSKSPTAESPQITMLGMPVIINAAQSGECARRRGKGWEANWFVARFVVEFLFEIIMGTENSQEAFNNLKDADGLYQGGFGKGATDMPDWGNYNGFYPVIPTSVGLEAGDGVCLVPYNLPQTEGTGGEAYKTFNVPVFFGLVGAGFGNLWQWVRGLIMDVGEEKSLVYFSPSMYADYGPNTVADKIMVAECPRKEGYIKRKSYQGLCCMPTEVGGTMETRFGDYFWGTSKGLRVRAAGGAIHVGTSAGASCTDSNHDAMYGHTIYSAPLCYFTEDPIIPDSQSIANNS